MVFRLAKKVRHAASLSKLEPGEVEIHSPVRALALLFGLFEVARQGGVGHGAVEVAGVRAVAGESRPEWCGNLAAFERIPI